MSGKKAPLTGVDINNEGSQNFPHLTQDDLENVAVDLAKHFKNASFPWATPIFLYGDLGAGKSTFCRKFIQSLTSDSTVVPSPTFTIMQEYASLYGAIAHFDLYRITDSDELYDVGFFEALQNSLCLIEWSERLDTLSLPSPCLKLYFFEEDESHRCLRLEILT